MSANWQPRLAISQLPVTIQEYFIFEAICLLAEISNDCYDPEYIPAREKSTDSQMVRTKSGRPDWYLNIKSDDKNIRRYRVKKALNRIIVNRDGCFGIRRFSYDCLMRNLIQKRLMDGYFYMKVVLPNNNVRKYFGHEPSFILDEIININDQIIEPIDIFDNTDEYEEITVVPF